MVRHSRAGGNPRGSGRTSCSEPQERPLFLTSIISGVALPVVVAHTSSCVFTLEADMATVQRDMGQSPLILHTRPVFEMSDELFFNFCQTNREWRIERNALGRC